MNAPLRMVAVSIACLALGVSSCAPPPSVPLSVAVPPLEQNALLYIAEAEGFFTRAGLDVVVRDFDSGASALNALFDGQADISEAAEFPVVSSILAGRDLRVLACNDRFENDYLVARKDRGIQGFADLKGKKIGVARGTVAEFFLSRFLAGHGVKPDAAIIVDVRPAAFVSTLSSGEIDALVAWQPYVNTLQQSLGSPLTLPVQESQMVYGLLVARADWLEENAASVEQFLGALRNAEQYAMRNPERAKEIVMARLGYEREYIDTVWPQHRHSLSLDLSLIAAMSDEARWMKERGGVPGAGSPDFRDYIYTSALKTVKPRAVDIGR
jgi:NitT/TauT family transport system substrate-binding protein